MSEAESPRAPSLGAEIVAGLLGVVVSLCCVVIPPHIVWAPLGPLIGGFVAGTRAPAGGRARFIIAFMIGLAPASILMTIALVIGSLATADELPAWFPRRGSDVATAGAVAWLYATVLALVGASIARAVQKPRRDAAEERDSSGDG